MTNRAGQADFLTSRYNTATVVSTLSVTVAARNHAFTCISSTVADCGRTMASPGASVCVSP